MRLQVLEPSEHPDFLDLPWLQPLADWQSPRLVAIPQGMHRHVVRFIDYNGALYVLKELPAHVADREYRILRHLEALLCLADLEHSFLLSGSGELIEPDDGILAIGSGGNFALAAARALYYETALPAREVVRRSLDIAADICVYTNRNLTLVELPPR